MASNDIKINTTVEMPDSKKVNKQIHSLEKNVSPLKIFGNFNDTPLKKLKNQINDINDSLSKMLSMGSDVINLVSKIKSSINELNKINSILTESSKTVEQLSKNDTSNLLNSHIKNFADSSISAMKEAIKCVNDYESSINSLSNTFNNVISNITDSTAINNVAKNFNNSISATNSSTPESDSDSSASTELSGKLSDYIKSVGRDKMYSLIYYC